MEGSNMVSYMGPVEYSIEIALEKIETILGAPYNLSKRSIGILLLKEDSEIRELVRRQEPEALPQIDQILEEVKAHYTHPIEYEMAIKQNEEAVRIARKVMSVHSERTGFADRLSFLTMNPVTGWPILFVVLYYGLYKFVGDFGAGTAVDFIEGTVFENHVNPYMEQFFTGLVPWPPVRDLLVGEFGVLTLGLRYAVAIIMPIVTFFFLVFSVIEDSGYLPRLAMLIDRTFKRIGLSGRAVIPMTLGFGCGTMATMVTRTLPTLRERVISTMLIALAVPCSAQLGVILAILEGRPGAMFIWTGIVAAIFLFVGFLTAKLLPGDKPSFYMEVPPLRLPKLSNVLTKTYVRMKWYFKEILPLFLFASVLIWVGQLTRLFDFLIEALRKPMEWIGLPPEAAKVFLFGFFRRDYGAAGLYDVNKSGVLDGVQLTVACIALTLFLPCVAQFLMVLKERGWKIGVGIALFIIVISYTAAYVTNVLLTTLGVAL
ncbi:MAG: ferrous iron transporter B [Nitrospiraceae bacterium]|nr:MAG: ferrous iron transporter B [Nitrospiraceae bacterium]